MTKNIVKVGDKNQHKNQDFVTMFLDEINARFNELDHEKVVDIKF